MNKNISPITFIDRLVKKNELGQPFKLTDIQREILRLAFTFDVSGCLPWDTIIYSCVKKSGKTTINGAVTLAWGFTQEAPNEILVLANDLEQTLARVFKTMEGIIKFNPELQREAEVQSRTIYLANGSTIVALSGDFAGSAGSNHGLVSYDELWGYVSESSTRLWEELTPVPTRRNSIRFITTYAGFEGESKLLWDLYKQVVSKDEHPEGQGERIHPDLPIYANREARIFCYWDHEPRMPWQTPEYYDAQKRTLRPGAYLRFHENKWATAEEIFITPELWDPCVDQSHRPTTTAREPLFVGIDIGIKHDNAARVAVRWDEAGEKLILVSYRIWKPTPAQPLDLEATVEEDLRDLADQCDLVEALIDPYQAHRSVTTLQAAGLPIKEFPQTTANCTRMGQVLFDLLNGKNLVLYASEELRQQALSTVAIENPRGWRIAKEKASKKIDAIVALSMAAVAAMAHKHEIRRRQASGFNIGLHVSKGELRFKPGWPLFIGQTYINRNVTVIGQALDNGQVNVLAALISEGLSLRAHLEQHVHPWFAANVIEASRAATRRSPLLVALEDADDSSSPGSSACQTLQEFFVFEFGQLTTVKRPLEERRRVVMDLLVKAMPFTFRPALQLDPIHARPLAEALNTPFYERSSRTQLEKINHSIVDGLALMLLRAELWKRAPKDPKPPRMAPSPMSA
jgi:phage terminase large subunit-like protein